jgi:hypothetical protein
MTRPDPRLARRGAKEAIQMYMSRDLIGFAIRRSPRRSDCDLRILAAAVGDRDRSVVRSPDAGKWSEPGVLICKHDRIDPGGDAQPTQRRSAVIPAVIGLYGTAIPSRSQQRSG